MAMKPKCPPIPPHSAPEEVRRVLGISTGEWDKCVKDGTFKKISRGECDVADCVQSYVAKARRAARQELDDERVRKLRNENARLEGDVIPLAQAQDAAMAFAQLVKSNVEGIPGRVASELARADDAAVVRTRLREEVATAFNAALEAFRSLFKKDAGGRGGDPGGGAAEEPG